jgi:predicted unusual protein kinase regulating ubiquinone biosynthesis (AarF/ABC1/UbiB family)
MTLSLEELIAALPPESDEAVSPSSVQEELQRLLGRLGGKPVPVSRLARLWVLGSVHAKIAAAYLAYWVRSSYATADEKERLLNETHLAAAIKLLGAMSYLRGSVAKVGQMLAAYPNLVPEQFVKTLSTLHFEAPPMHFGLLREFLRNELGADPREVFAEFETEAFAAASLGQVHRARLKSGECVAVKVQYPGIAKTIESDFRNMLALFTPMRLSKDWDSIRAQGEDIRRIIEGETDYLREASFSERAKAVFDRSDGIVIPNTFPKFTTQRVLTMEYLDGVHIDRYLAGRPSQEERDRYGTLVMRASFRTAHKARFWYADSNPGNYLFLPDGSLGLIDFGCCREFTEDEWDFYKQVWKVYRHEDRAGLRAAMIRAADLDPTQPLDEEHVRFLEEFCNWFSEDLLYDGPFDFGDEDLIRRGVELTAEVAKKRYFRSMPVNVWIDRQLFGLRALAYRLKARINMKRLAQEEEWGILDADNSS